MKANNLASGLSIGKICKFSWLILVALWLWKIKVVGGGQQKVIAIHCWNQNQIHTARFPLNNLKTRYIFKNNLVSYILVALEIPMFSQVLTSLHISCVELCCLWVIVNWSVNSVINEERMVNQFDQTSRKINVFRVSDNMFRVNITCFFLYYNMFILLDCPADLEGPPVKVWITLDFSFQIKF